LLSVTYHREVLVLKLKPTIPKPIILFIVIADLI